MINNKYLLSALFAVACGTSAMAQEEAFDLTSQRGEKQDVNMVLVGGLLAFEQTGFTSAFMAAFWYNACSLAVSEAVVCYVLGLLLLKALEKTKFFKDLQKKD